MFGKDYLVFDQPFWADQCCRPSDSARTRFKRTMCSIFLLSLIVKASLPG